MLAEASVLAMVQAHLLPADKSTRAYWYGSRHPGGKGPAGYCRQAP